MGIKFGTNPVGNINFQDEEELLVRFEKSWYSELSAFSDLTEEAGVIYLSVLKGYSNSCISKSEISIFTNNIHDVRRECFDVVYIAQEPDSAFHLEKKDGKIVGMPDKTFYVDEANQVLLVKAKGDSGYDLKKILSVYHVLCPWINKNLLSANNANEISIHLRSFAKALFSNSSRLESVGKKFESFLVREIFKSLKWSEVQDTIKSTFMEGVISKVKQKEEEYKENLRRQECLLEELRELDKDIKKIGRDLRDLQEDENELSDDTQSVICLMNSSNVDILDVSGNSIKFSLKSILRSFDESEYKIIMKNRFRNESEDVKKILDSIFIDRTLSVRLESRFTWIPEGIKIEPCVNTPFGYDAIMHPHIMRAHCYGNKSMDIRKWIMQKDWERVLSTIMALNSNINCGDGAVFPSFVAKVKKLIHENDLAAFLQKTENGWEGVVQ